MQTPANPYLMPAWIEYMACTEYAASGVIATQGIHIDLFGTLVLALVIAGGGAPSATA